MAFLLRSALVIGVIYWLSPVHERAGEAAAPLAPAAGVENMASLAGEAVREGQALALWQQLDAEARRRLLALFIEEPAARPAAGRDTLSRDDRTIPWRGHGSGG